MRLSKLPLCRTTNNRPVSRPGRHSRALFPATTVAAVAVEPDPPKYKKFTQERRQLCHCHAGTGSAATTDRSTRCDATLKRLVCLCRQCVRSRWLGRASQPSPATSQDPTLAHRPPDLGNNGAGGLVQPAATGPRTLLGAGRPGPARSPEPFTRFRRVRLPVPVPSGSIPNTRSGKDPFQRSGCKGLDPAPIDLPCLVTSILR